MSLYIIINLSLNTMNDVVLSGEYIISKLKEYIQKKTTFNEFREYVLSRF